MRPLYYADAIDKHPAHVRDTAPVNAFDHGLAGYTWGGVYDPALEWLDGDGWRFALRCDPHELGVFTRKLNLLPSIAVAGWAVPTLVGLDGVPAVGYFGPNGFTVPPVYRDTVEKVQALLDYRGVITDEHAALAVVILTINHHVTIHELAAVQALTRPFVAAVIFAAAGVPPDAATMLARGE
jgi:hypothetical protein